MEFNFELELPKTWFIDLDGTLLKHNGYKNQKEEILPGIDKLFDKIKDDDIVIITTARNNIYKKNTIEFLKNNNIRYDKIIFDLPPGERILINDMKPDGTRTAYCLNVIRDGGF